jgi:SOS-response transcriptional repressor LexA
MLLMPCTPTIEYEDVAEAADALVSAGQSPTIRRLRDRLGTGSDTSIHRHLKAYRAKQALAERPAVAVPDDAIRAISGVMERHAAVQSVETQQASTEAQDEADAIAETAERVEDERDEAIERERIPKQR